MKKLFSLFPVVVLFILTGCSSTYRVSDFSSKEKFYEDFNNYAKNKSLKVTLTNDSSFSALNGASVSNDSLILFTDEQKVNKEFVSLNKIKEVRGKNRFVSASIGFAAGTSLGYMTALIGIGSENNSKEGSNWGYSIVAGLLGGTAIGWFTGFDYIYQFNP